MNSFLEDFHVSSQSNLPMATVIPQGVISYFTSLSWSAALRYGPQQQYTSLYQVYRKDPTRSISNAAVMSPSVTQTNDGPAFIEQQGGILQWRYLLMTKMEFNLSE